MLLNIARTIALGAIWLIILLALTGCAYIYDLVDTTCAEAREIIEKECTK